MKLFFKSFKVLSISLVCSYNLMILCSGDRALVSSRAITASIGDIASFEKDDSVNLREIKQKKELRTSKRSRRNSHRIGRTFSCFGILSMALMFLSQPYAVQAGVLDEPINPIRDIPIIYCPDESTKNAILEIAKQGNAEAQYRIGKCFEEGQGTEENPSEAGFWLESAALQGHPQAELALAKCIDKKKCEFGHKDVESDEEADEKSDNKNNVDEELGNKYKEFNFEESDMEKYERKEIEQLLERAASKGLGEAQLELGYRTSNETRACELFESAAQRSIPEAQYSYGECFDFGRGGKKKNKIEAQRWYNKARRQGLNCTIL